MQTTFAVLAALASVAAAQSSLIAAGSLTPTASAPAGCSTSYSGSFEITVVKASAAKRDVIEKRATTCAAENILVATLKSGVLTDSKGRIGGIVANHQFQFDGPPSQAGTIYNGGWSVCNNGSLAIGNDAVWYQCLSGDFYNLYNEAVGAECQQVLIDIIPCTVSSGTATAAGAATQSSDGQVVASSAATAVTQIGDGQIQASSAVPVSQFTDGQLQATTLATAVVSQFSDGQIQATTVKSTTTAAPVSQISDGQIQATSAKKATTTAAPVSQISDGQIQATSVGTVTSSKKTTTAAATTAIFTGAAARGYASYGAAVVGAAAMALL